MRLVEDVHRWWRWHSTWVFAVLAAGPMIWLSSPDLQALLPPRIVSVIAPCIAVLGFVLRLRKQVHTAPPPKHDHDDESAAP